MITVLDQSFPLGIKWGTLAGKAFGQGGQTLKSEIKSRGRGSYKDRSGPDWEELPRSRTRNVGFYRTTWVITGIQEGAGSDV